MNRIVVATVLLVSVLVVGCEKNYNRADISCDGRRIAFALNSDGKFKTDNSSEIYVVTIDEDLAAAGMMRLTSNRVCDSWASFAPGADVLLWVQGTVDESDVQGMVICAGSDRVRIQLTGGVRALANFPLFLDERTIFFGRLRPGAAPKESEIVCEIIKLRGEKDTPGSTRREIVAIPWNARERLWSTLPAFHDGTMYYMVGRPVQDVLDIDDNGKSAPVLNVTLYAVETATGVRRALRDFNFASKANAQGDGDGFAGPVGMADLAVSPDGKKLVCCFLPGEDFNLTAFDDQAPSYVFVVDLEGDEAPVAIQHRAYVYYPQFAPLLTDTPKTPSDYQVVFLSGAGLADGRSVYISDLSGNTKRLATFPGKVMTAYTGWTWLAPDRLRIFHVSDEGLVVVDTSRDGAETTRRELDHESLLALKHAADARAGLDDLKSAVANALEASTPPDGPPAATQAEALVRTLEESRQQADGAAKAVRLSDQAPSVKAPTTQPFDVPGHAKDDAH